MLSLWGPVPGSHDSEMLCRLNWLPMLSKVMLSKVAGGQCFCLFGNAGFAQHHHLHVMFKGIITTARRWYNALMARLRIFVENVVGNNHCLFNKLAFKEKLKLGGWGLKRLYPVATFLFNVHTCLYSNQFTRMVYRKTELALRPSVREFLAMGCTALSLSPSSSKQHRL